MVALLCRSRLSSLTQVTVAFHLTQAAFMRRPERLRFADGGWQPTTIFMRESLSGWKA